MLHRNVSLLFCLLLGAASAQLWSPPQAFAKNPAMQGFRLSGNQLIRGNTVITLDTVAGRVVGVLIDAPASDADSVARALVTAWDADVKSIAKLTATLQKPSFQTSTRQGLLDTTSEEGTDLIAVRLVGEGSKARWNVYSALNILPESTFPATRNLSGQPSAPNTIHILSDFQCPACLNLWQESLPDWRKNAQTYRIYYHHYPLSYHKNAFAAAEASECAAQQGKFWPMSDQLFGRYNTWARAGADTAQQQFLTFASNLKLDQATFKKCLTSHTFKTEVERQMQAGAKVYLTGTPTVYLNGIKLREFSRQEMQSVQAVTQARPSAAQIITARLKNFR